MSITYALFLLPVSDTALAEPLSVATVWNRWVSFRHAKTWTYVLTTSESNRASDTNPPFQPSSTKCMNEEKEEKTKQTWGIFLTLFTLEQTC